MGGEQRTNNETLVQRIQAGERELIPELWAQVGRLVCGMAYKRVHATNGAGGVTVDDLQQAGFLGLLRALETFDPAAGCKFSTWLVYHVRAAFGAAQGHKIDPVDRAGSLDAPLDGCSDDPLALGDVIPDPGAAQALEGVGAWDSLHRAVAGLPEAQRAVIHCRYWLEQSTAEIAAAIGIPAAAVRKLEAAALRALRHPSVSRSLR